MPYKSRTLLRFQTLTRMRAEIAERLLGATQQTAMLTTFNEVNMAPVMALSAGMGGALGAGFLFAAKRAEASELALVEEVAALNSGE